MISIDHGAAFVHIPKCAGTSVRAALRPHGFAMPPRTGRRREKRTGAFRLGMATRLARAVGNDWGRLYRFTVSRNPYDRLVSGWNYGREKGRIDVGFAYFVRNLDTFTEPWIEWHCGMTQKRHLTVGVEPSVDAICRFENLDEDLAAVGERLGLHELSVPVRNRRRDDDHRGYYTDELRDIAFERFAVDFDYFGYDHDL